MAEIFKNILIRLNKIFENFHHICYLENIPFCFAIFQFDNILYSCTLSVTTIPSQSLPLFFFSNSKQVFICLNEMQKKMKTILERNFPNSQLLPELESNWNGPLWAKNKK